MFQLQLTFILITIGAVCISGHDEGTPSFLDSLSSSLSLDNFDSSYMLYPTSGSKQNFCRKPNVIKSTKQDKPININSEIGLQYGESFARLISFMPRLVQDVLRFILENPFVGVVGLGSLIALIKQYFWVLYNMCHEQYTTTLEVFSDQPTYRWLENWLNAKDWGSCQHVTGVGKAYSHQDDCSCAICQGSEKSGGAPDFVLVPNFSSYGFQYKDHWINIGKNSNKDDKNNQQDSSSYSILQHSALTKSLHLTTTGKNPKIFEELLSECREFYIEQSKAGTSTVLWRARSGYWDHNGDQRKRPLESVVMKEGVLDELVTDITEFIESGKWYIERGIPYRRGYLLYGPPGCGKTSIISAIAGHLEYSVAILSLSNKYMNDDTLSDLMSSIPERSVVLMEDIDAAFKSREESSEEIKKHENNISFSGLLNAIDGVACADGRILFMTTNYIDRLDSALVRPGRVDMKMKIDYCSEEQIHRLFKRFYPQYDQVEMEILGEVLVKKFKQESDGPLVSLTPAELQGHLLLHRHNPNNAVEYADSFVAKLDDSRKESAKLKEFRNRRNSSISENSEELNEGLKNEDEKPKTGNEKGTQVAESIKDNDSKVRVGKKKLWKIFQ